MNNEEFIEAVKTHEQMKLTILAGENIALTKEMYIEHGYDLIMQCPLSTWFDISRAIPQNEFNALELTYCKMIDKTWEKFDKRCLVSFLSIIEIAIKNHNDKK